MKDLASKLEALSFYDESFIKTLEEKINNADSEIKNAIFNWLDNQIEEEIIVHDVSFSLLKECGMEVIGAYLTLDWVKRDPEYAILALKSEYYPAYKYFKDKQQTYN